MLTDFFRPVLDFGGGASHGGNPNPDKTLPTDFHQKIVSLMMYN
jgi:hypothetical protein